MSEDYTKPTVFLSHSSRDKKTLVRLQSKLLEKIGSSVQAFLSSDGQSIRLGRNWVHEIEEALSATRLMFVFVSPASLESQWVLFEAGFAYGQKINVVPIGIHGIDLEEVKPPLSILQGFNVTSPSSLANIIHVINKEFHFTFNAEFSETQYRYIFMFGDGRHRSQLGRYTMLVDDLQLEAGRRNSETLIGVIREYFREKAVDLQERGGDIYAQGISFRTGLNRILIEPSVTAVTLPLLDELLPLMLSDVNDQIAATVKLRPQIRAVTLTHKISGLLFDTPISLATDGWLRFGEITFSINQHYTSRRRDLPPSGLGDIRWARRGLQFEDSDQEPTFVEISIRYRGSTSAVPFADLLDLLFERGVLFTKQ